MTDTNSCYLTFRLMEETKRVIKIIKARNTSEEK